MSKRWSIDVRGSAAWLDTPDAERRPFNADELARLGRDLINAALGIDERVISRLDGTPAAGAYREMVAKHGNGIVLESGSKPFPQMDAFTSERPEVRVVNGAVHVCVNLAGTRVSAAMDPVTAAYFGNEVHGAAWAQAVEIEAEDPEVFQSVMSATTGASRLTAESEGWKLRAEWSRKRLEARLGDHCDDCKASESPFCLHRPATVIAGQLPGNTFPRWQPDPPQRPTVTLGSPEAEQLERETLAAREALLRAEGVVHPEVAARYLIRNGNPLAAARGFGNPFNDDPFIPAAGNPAGRRPATGYLDLGNSSKMEWDGNGNFRVDGGDWKPDLATQPHEERSHGSAE